MFLGTHTPKLDEKGRFFLPAKFRDELAAGLVITRAQDRCLAIYPSATFVEMTKQVMDAPATVKQVRPRGWPSRWNSQQDQRRFWTVPAASTISSRWHDGLRAHACTWATIPA